MGWQLPDGVMLGQPVEVVVDGPTQILHSQQRSGTMGGGVAAVGEIVVVVVTAGGGRAGDVHDDVVGGARAGDVHDEVGG